MSSIWKQLKVLKNAVDNELNDVLETSIGMIDLIDIGYALLRDEINPMDDCNGEALVESYIENLLLVSQYIETDTTMESVIPDSLYDALYEKYKDMTGKDITGTPIVSSSRPIREHRYPEARGSLDKVHFVRDKDIPKDDKKKSLETWLRSVIKKCEAAGIPYKNAQLAADVKHDGLCTVFEFSGKKLDHALTRRDVDLNQGVDITHIFKDMGDKLIDMLHFQGVPMELFECKKFGIKTEIMVSDMSFDMMKKEMTRPPKNRRSAASMILNTSKDEYNPEWSKYLTIQPLQLCVEGDKMDFSMDKIGLKIYSWYYIGMINGRYQYIQPRMDHYGADFTLGKLEASMNLFETFIIDNVKSVSKGTGTLTDGVVITIMDQDIIQLLGRENNRNKFQVAYKFPAGIAKTKLLDVEFQVGPIAGTITPVAKIEPIKIMGNTISSPGLSNCDKMEKLQLRKGDEVMIRYDIVPILYKDDTCKPGDGEVFKTPKTCPICQHGLTVKDAIIRCMNPYCGARTVGRVYNYVNKLNMDGIGKATIEDLVDLGVVKTIGDLYRLENHKEEIVELPGYGIKKYSNIIKGVNKQRTFYPHQVLGALGIPDIGRRMMEKVCRAMNPNVLIQDIFAGDKPVIAQLEEIDGIAFATANKIYEGILMNKDVIEDLLHYVEFKEYEEKSESDTVVLFTKVRDKKFQEFLENQGIAIASGYSKKVTTVIVPSLDVTSSKVTKAKEDGKEIISLDDMKKRYNYKE